MTAHVLQLDIQGTPQAWITLEEAATHYATANVVWEDGDTPLATLRGGHNVQLGRQSELVIAPIIALRGAAKLDLFAITPHLTKAKLLRRDRPAPTAARCSVTATCSANTSCRTRAAAPTAG